MAKKPNGGGKPVLRDGKTGRFVPSRGKTAGKTVINQTPETARGTDKPPSRPPKTK